MSNWLINTYTYTLHRRAASCITLCIQHMTGAASWSNIFWNYNNLIKRNGIQRMKLRFMWVGSLERQFLTLDFLDSGNGVACLGGHTSTTVEVAFLKSRWVCWGLRVIWNLFYEDETLLFFIDRYLTFVLKDTNRLTSRFRQIFWRHEDTDRNYTCIRKSATFWERRNHLTPFYVLPRWRPDDPVRVFLFEQAVNDRMPDCICSAACICSWHDY